MQAANPKGQLKPGASARISRSDRDGASRHGDSRGGAADRVGRRDVCDYAGSPAVSLTKIGVKVGIRDGDDVQIIDGVKVGDRVVTEGAFELSSEDPDVLAKTSIQVRAPKPAGLRAGMTTPNRESVLNRREIEDEVGLHAGRNARQRGIAFTGADSCR